MLQTPWYMAGRALIGLYVRNLLRANVSTVGPLPRGPKIIAVNHPSTGDPAFITTLIREHASILILDAVFRVPLFGRSLRWSGHIPVVPGRGREAFDEAVRRLKAGRTIVIFPEGVISTPGGFNHFHSGAARLALATGAPVVPVGISLDSSRIRIMEHKIENHNDPMAWYLHGPYAMTVGAPLTFEGSVEDAGRVHAVTEAIRQQIIGLAKAGSLRLACAQHQAQRSAGTRRNLFTRAGSWAARGVGLRLVQSAMFLFMAVGKH